MKEPMTRKERMRYIDLQIAELRSERRQLEEADAYEFQNTHLDNIGRCFRTPGGRFVIILNVPQIDRSIDSKFGSLEFNQYQFPAFYITPENGEDEDPFFFDLAFTRDGVSFGNDPVFNESPWEEITLDGFKVAFASRLDKLCKRIFKSKDGGNK